MTGLGALCGRAVLGLLCFGLFGLVAMAVAFAVLAGLGVAVVLAAGFMRFATASPLFAVVGSFATGMWLVRTFDRPGMISDYMPRR